MEIRELKTVGEIVSVMNMCKSEFYLEKYREMDEILLLASKFQKHGNFLALLNDHIVGFIAYYANDQKSLTAYISMIIIRKEFHSMGYGKFLINTAIARSESLGMKRLKLEVNKLNLEAINFYKKLGFSVLEEATNESFYMVKNINYKH